MELLRKPRADGVVVDRVVVAAAVPEDDVLDEEPDAAFAIATTPPAIAPGLVC